LPSLEDVNEATPVPLAEAGEVYLAEVEAQIVAVNNGTGLIPRCPSCNQVMDNGKCSKDGDVKPKADLRIIATLDDGYACKRAIFDRDAVTDLTGIPLEDAKEIATDAMDRSIVETKMTDRVVNRTVKVTATTFGDALAVQSVEEPNNDLESKAEKLLDEVSKG